MNPSNFLDTAPGKVIKTRTGYWAFVPAPLPPDLTWSLEVVSLLGEAERNLARLSAFATGWPAHRLLARPFAHREAVLSSRIEGTRASIADVLTYAAQLSFLETAPDAKEVHNYVRAMENGLQMLPALPVSLRLIREIHAVLMEGVRGEHLTPGEFRRSQNWIGTPGSTLDRATYVPPPIDEMFACLDALEKFIHTPSDIPALVRAALVHYQFEAIHPFLDGNGRIGRLLVVLLLCEWDILPQPLLYLSEYFEAHRLEYYDRLLAVSQRGQWNEWLTFFLKGVSGQALDAYQRLERLQALRSGYLVQMQTERAAARLAQAVDLFFERPIMSIRQLESGLQVPYKTAQRYVNRLEELGILNEVTGKSRNRLYRADAILRLVSA